MGRICIGNSSAINILFVFSLYVHVEIYRCKNCRLFSHPYFLYNMNYNVYMKNEWDEGEERGALLQGSEPDRE